MGSWFRTNVNPQTGEVGCGLLRLVPGIFSDLRYTAIVFYLGARDQVRGGSTSGNVLSFTRGVEARLSFGQQPDKPSPLFGKRRGNFSGISGAKGQFSVFFRGQTVDEVCERAQL